jgi:carbamoyl-phosphate synthase large subunit
MRTTVAVSGLHLGENCQPGPGVIRSLREAIPDEVEIVGLAYDALDSSLHVPGLLDDAFLVPYPSVQPGAYLARLLEIREAVGLDVIVPCLDVELPLLMRLAPRLRELGIAVVLPGAEAFARRGKDRLPELAREAGVATPETLRILDTGALADAGKRLGYPLVVKGPFYEAEVAAGPAEAAAAFDKLSSRWGLPLIAQRFVKGDEFDVVALGDGEGALLGAVAMRKTIVTRLGKAWGAVTVADEELLATASRVVGELRWRGGCELELLRGASDGRLYLIEVNPRFPAWVYLATAAGANLPLGLLRLAQGEPPPPLDSYRAGVWYVRHAAEAVGELGGIESLVTEGRLQRTHALGKETVA